MKTMDDLVKRLHEDGFEFTSKDLKCEENLSIQSLWNSDGKHHTNQSIMICKIITSMGINMCNPSKTPADKVSIGKIMDDEPICESGTTNSLLER